jgi:hypothetical protein
MLISVHLPKTAGSSFRKSLAEHFGERLFEDYGDRPINTPPFRRNLQALCRAMLYGAKSFRGIECIHGHFLPLKYAALRFRQQTRWVTWLRDPADRLVSHYHYFQRTYTPAAPSRLQRRMVEEQWSLERFCLCRELRNFYSQFLWGLPRGWFDFIGLVEHYAEDMRDFARALLGVALPMYEENVNADKQSRGYTVDPELRKQIEAWHARDVALYRQALARRQARLQAGTTSPDISSRL